MIKEPLIAHSELTNEIYVVVGKEKYPVTEQAIKAVMATKVLDKEPILDKIKAEIEKQEKWLLQAGYNEYNVDIAFSSIKSVLAESEEDNEPRR